jgi:hypothetical protein
MFRLPSLTVTIAAFLAVLSCVVCAVPTQAAPLTYTVRGLTGSIEGNPLHDDGSCPFGRTADTKYLTILKQAMDAGDPDKCPVAIVKSTDAAGGATEQLFPLASCHRFYQSISKKTSDFFKEVPIETAKIALCSQPYYDAVGGAIPLGMRNTMLNLQLNGDATVKTMLGEASRSSGTAIEGLTNAHEFKEVKDKKEKEEQAKEKCFSKTLDKIESYWAGKGAINCVKNGKDQIVAYYDEAKKELASLANDCKTHGSNIVAGFSVSVMAPANLASCIIEFATTAASIATKIKDMTDWINNGCQQGAIKAKEVSEWRKNALGSLCQTAENLVERAFTQCIRVDVSFNLNLPQFRILLQCPWNVNLTYRLGNQGFNCFRSTGRASIGLNSNFLGLGGGGGFGSIGGGRGMLSRSGGMESLFDGSCFERAVPTSRTGGAFKSLNDIKESSIPGLECGTLSTDPKYNTPIQGVKPLQSGVIQNGWVAGPNPAGTETINGVQITRCDYFQSGRRVRMTYVYGNAASCNNTLNAFKDGAGKETNTSCYSTGGYTPAETPAVPDGCLYPRDCLSNSGKFSTALQGTGNCPANVEPAFKDTNQYLYTTGGVGAAAEWRSCQGMNNALFDPAPVCCDPQIQNCIEVNNDLARKRLAAIPLCKCNEGSATNKPDPNKQDGSCLDGGYATCCASSLNKVMDAKGNVLKDAQGRDVDGCTAPRNVQNGYNAGGLGLPQTELCRGEAPTCLAANECGKIKTADGKEKSICADQVAISRPSPYMYLFVRPDAQIPSNTDGSFNPNATQCCTSKWCNICPQHYANAYGLSLIRSSNISVVPYGSFAQSRYDQSINDAIIGKGWPYVGVQDEFGATSYKVGRTALPYPVSVYYDWNNGFLGLDNKDGNGPYTFVNPETGVASYPYKKNNWRRPAQLMISDGLDERWLQPSFQACNNLPGLAGKWKASYTPEDQMADDAIFASPYYTIQGNEAGSNGQWISTFSVPEPQEYPIDFYNRIVGAGQETTVMGVGVPNLPSLELCEDVIKVCEPGSGSALTGGNSGQNTGSTTPAAGGCTPGIFGNCDTTGYQEPKPPENSTNAAANTAAGSTTTTAPPPAATTPGPTVVPSVTTPATQDSTNSGLKDLF